MKKQLLNLLLCVSILLAGCAGPQAGSTTLKIPADTTPPAELQNVLRRAHQHKVISEDWGSLSWLASKPLGNAEGLTVGRATIKPGQTNPRHRHPKSEEVLYLLKGRINHTLDDKTITMSAGDVITIAPGVFHNASCIGSEDAEMVIVYSQGTRGFELE
jgi:quercetin dioxygenase-like cupin family protein